MKRANSVKALEDLGRVRLSPNFFMRDFLYSEIANHYAMPNIPDDPDLAIYVGRHLCVELLEPLHAKAGMGNHWGSHAAEYSALVGF